MDQKTFQAIEAADLADLSVSEKAAVFLTSTQSICSLIEETVCPVIESQLEKSQYEEAIEACLVRLCLLLKGLGELEDPRHFQIANATCRTVFEIVLDLKELEADETNAEKYFAFARVSKFRKAKQLAHYLDTNPAVDRDPHQPALDFVSDPSRESQIEAECERLWGKTKKGKTNWPDHWSGKKIPERARDAGTRFEEIYKSKFFFLSYHVHAGPAGIQSLSNEDLIRTFFLAHRLVQELAAIALEIVGEVFHLFKTNLELKKKLAAAQASGGFYGIQMLLEKTCAEETEGQEK